MIKKITFILVSLSLFLSVLCLICADSIGQDTPCPLMTGHPASLCSMNPLEHIQEWQSAFTATFTTNFLLSVITLISFLGAIKIFKIKKDSLSLFSSQITTYLRIFVYIKILNPLNLAFSQGILNSKAG